MKLCFVWCWLLRVCYSGEIVDSSPRLMRKIGSLEFLDYRILEVGIGKRERYNFTFKVVPMV